MQGGFYVKIHLVFTPDRISLYDIPFSQFPNNKETALPNYVFYKTEPDDNSTKKREKLVKAALYLALKGTKWGVRKWAFSTDVLSVFSPICHRVTEHSVYNDINLPEHVYLYYEDFESKVDTEYVKLEDGIAKEIKKNQEKKKLALTMYTIAGVASGAVTLNQLGLIDFKEIFKEGGWADANNERYEADKRIHAKRIRESMKAVRENMEDEMAVTAAKTTALTLRMSRGGAQKPRSPEWDPRETHARSRTLKEPAIFQKKVLQLAAKGSPKDPSNPDPSAMDAPAIGVAVQSSGDYESDVDYEDSRVFGDVLA
jgi:hypothetical protein